MNYLAHVFLARQSEAAMVGAMLGDFVKGDPTGRYTPEIEREIRLHRRIDSFTDRHPAVRAARQLFDPPRRRFSGIALDVFYDHVLSARWAAYGDQPRDVLIARFYAALRRHQHQLPEPLAAIAPAIVARDWLGAYADFANIAFAIDRMSRRLSRNGELLRDCLIDLRAHRTELAESFDALFPDLIAFTDATRPT
jgi:acyl carrier protein phosphodiesterase